MAFCLLSLSVYLFFLELGSRFSEYLMAAEVVLDRWSLSGRRIDHVVDKQTLCSGLHFNIGKSVVFS